VKTKVAKIEAQAVDQNRESDKPPELLVFLDHDSVFQYLAEHGLSLLEQIAEKHEKGATARG
jgi:hypothetical protein